MTNKTLRTLGSAGAISDADLMLIRQGADTVDKAISMANLKLEMAKNTRCIYARDYGAKFDGKTVKNVTTTSGSAVVSSTDYTFTTADIGKRFVIKAAENSTVYMASAGSTIAGTISSVSAGAATLSANMTSTNSTAVIYFGTDDTAAIQAAVNAGNPGDATLGASGQWLYSDYAAVILPAGLSLITAEIVLRPGVSIIGQGKFATWIKWASPTTMATAGYYAAFHGGQANGSTRIYKDVQFRSLRIDMTAAYTTVFSYHAKCIEMIFCMRLCAIDVYFEGSPATSLGCDYIAGGLVYGCTFEYAGRLWTAGGGGSSGIDFQTDDGDMFISNFQLTGDPDTRIVANNIFINCAVSAIRNTNDALTVRLSRDVLCNNLILSDLSSGKGIEDSGNTGSVIVGNTIYHRGTDQSSEGPGGTEGQHIWAGIVVTGGKGGIIANNAIHGGWYDGIRLMRFERSGSSVMPNNYIVTGNNQSGATRNGLRFDIDSTYTMLNVAATNNTFTLNGEAGVALSNSGTGGEIKFLDLSGNRVYDNGRTTATDGLKSGIYVNTLLTGAKLNDNYLYDSGALTQKYGFTFDGIAATHIMMNNNHASQNTTATGLNLINSATIAAGTSKTKSNLGIADV